MIGASIALCSTIFTFYYEKFNHGKINFSFGSSCCQYLLEKACQITLHAAQDEELIRGDQDYLCKMIDNLIQNACRYASTKVTVDCLWTDSEFCFTVEDDGAGISEDQLEEIFKPFYRAKNQSVKKSGGFGLGLAIVRRIVNWHNGSIKAGSSKLLGGASFEISLPISPD